MGFLGSLGGIVGGLAGNALLPGIGGALGSALGGALGGGGGGGGAPTSGGPNNAYIPTSRPQTDQDFLNNKNAYEQALQAQQGLLNPYNQQLLGSQFSNPYANVAQANSNQSGVDYENLGHQATNVAGQNWNYANQQLNNANQANQLYQSGLGNAQASSAALSNQAAQSNAQYQNLLNYQNGQLGNISGAQNQLYGGGNQVLNTALDPQKDLYNRTSQQITDQSRAAQYARGIQSSPLGASVESNALGNFNIDWQNQQLARQSQGLQAAQGAFGSAQGLGNSYTSNVAGLQAGQNEQFAGLTGQAQSQYLNYLNSMNQSNLSNTQNLNASQQNAFGLAQQGAQAAYNAGQAPYGTYQQIYGNQNQSLQNYAGNNQNYLSGLNQLQSNDLGYLNFGQGAQNQAFQQGQTVQNNQNTAIGQIAGQFANPKSGLSQIGNTIGGWFGGGSQGSYTPPPADYNWGSDITSGYGG